MELKTEHIEGGLMGLLGYAIPRILELAPKVVRVFSKKKTEKTLSEKVAHIDGRVSNLRTLVLVLINKDQQRKEAYENGRDFNSGAWDVRELLDKLEAEEKKERLENKE